MATLVSYLAVTVVMALALCQDCQAQTDGYVNIYCLKIKLMNVRNHDMTAVSTSATQ